jgi:hypothetical protein
MINQDINDAQVTVAFQIEATNAGDNRSLSMMSDEVIVSALAGDSGSLVLSMVDDDSTFTANGIDRDGVATAVTVDTPNGGTLESSREGFSFSLESVQNKLTEQGFADFLSEDGDYLVTMIISGLSINELEESSVVPAKQFSIDSGSVQATGAGFQGYLSVIVE